MKPLFAAVHESAIGPSGHGLLHRTCLLSGVKRTLRSRKIVGRMLGKLSL